MFGHVGFPAWLFFIISLLCKNNYNLDKFVEIGIKDLITLIERGFFYFINLSQGLSSQLLNLYSVVTNSCEERRVQIRKLTELWFDLWDEIWYGYVYSFWDWFWYYRKGKIKFHVIDLGDSYKVSACNGKETVWNCYGGTIEQAKEIALWRLRNGK